MRDAGIDFWQPGLAPADHTTMATSTNRLFSALVLVLAAAPAACSSFGSDPAPGASDSVPEPGRADAGDPDAGPKKAPVVNGTPDPSEFTESFGVFVAPNGQAAAAGTRKQPLASIQAGIVLGKSLGKRVYVCGGTFRESMVMADSISVIGGLDCSREEWRPGTTRTRVEAPASPAVAAKAIASATRMENLEIIAPDASEPGASSYGLLAVESPGLSLVSSRVEAGNGRKGADGVDGIQLVQTGTLNGANGRSQGDACFGLACSNNPGIPPGGTSICTGAAGKDGAQGGNGGTGGLYNFNGGIFGWVPVSASSAAAVGGLRSEGVAAKGTDGTSAAAGAVRLSADGYLPAGGTAGTDGDPGKAGSGGAGVKPSGTPPADPDFPNRTPRWFGSNGAGGGAGGCPGLAGTPGSGGGASIAIVVVGSPMTIDRSDLVAHGGGAGGRGTLGSSPSPGGRPGVDYALGPNSAGRNGSAGGAAGVSGSGAGGPSYGLAFTAAAPTMTKTTSKAGRGGDGVPELSNPDALGNPRTVPASAQGIAQDVLVP